MLDRHASRRDPSVEELLDELAGRDEAEAEGGRSRTDADSTLQLLKSELDTLAAQIREPAPVVPFEDESDCRRVTELVEALGTEPSQAQSTPSERAASEPLGELGQYQLLAELGQGGMGTVYKALHTRLDKIVALKVLPEQKTSDCGAVARFAREMRAVGKLEHPNIVRAMDANEHGAKHYLVMEYVDGINLSELVHRVGPLRIADACELIRQAAIGLQHAHEHGLVHRDIKPSNLMLTKAGLLKILDLGLARLHAENLGELTSTGQLMGTIDYMAPEQTRDSHVVDIRADIYGLGATLFKLLTDRAPYADKRHDMVIQKLIALTTWPVPSIDEHRDEVPGELAVIIKRMLAKEADDRYAIPQDVAVALKPFAANCDLPALIDCYEQYLAGDDNKRAPSIDSTMGCLTTPMTETTSAKVDEPEPPSFETTIAGQTHAIERASAGAPVKDSRSVTVNARRTAQKKRTKTVATIVGAAALLAAMALIVIQTDKGDIRVVAYDPAIEVVIKRNGRPVDGFQVLQRDGAAAYFSGEYQIEIQGGKPDGVVIANEKFTLTRGKDILVEISRGIPSTAPAHRPTEPSTDPDRRAGEWALSIGGRVGVNDQGPYEFVVELPREPFRLTTANFQENGRVTDAGLAHFKDCKNLVDLHLGETKVTDAGMAYFQGCTGLTRLVLVWTAVTDAGLANFKNCKNLTVLDLSATQVTDAGLAHFKDCQNLAVLHLGGATHVTDAGLIHLRACNNLKFVNLAGAALTDGGLETLAEFTLLSGVNVQSTKVTEAGVKDFAAALPGCKVEWDGGVIEPTVAADRDQ